MMLKRRMVFRWVNIILMLYGLIGIAVFYLQDHILFHPEKIDRYQAYRFTMPFKEINIAYNDSSNINIIQFTTGAAPRGVVLYFHGNSKNIFWYARYAPNFTKNGYEIWMIDYPGFGKSTGSLTEQRLYDYADQLYQLAASRFSKDSIVLYGKSLGTGIAAYLASRKNCRELILETPYYAMTELAAFYFPVYPVNRMIHYKLPTYQYLQQVIVPVTILHGTADGIIPYSQSEKLKPYLKSTDALIAIPGGSHNNLNDFPLFHQKLDSLLRR